MNPKHLRNEKGIALVIAMLLLLVITVLGISGVSTTTGDILISSNLRASQQAFYIAEAGVNEFMGRFRNGATNQIQDLSPSSPTWRLFLAIDANKAGTIGYTSTDNFTQSLENQLDFRVKVTHKVDLGNNVITSGGYPVYIVDSNGFTADGAKRVIEVELNKNPSLDPPGALYSERPVNVHGSSTYIQGMDQCGTNNKPGILTPLSNVPNDPITINGNPAIQGNPAKRYNSQNLDLRGMIDSLKNNANFKYDYNSSQTLSGYSDQWGKPTASDTTTPITYNGPMRVVYFNTHGNTLQLSGQSHGAGILLVDGNLDLHGGFTWYGVIIVMGAVDYTGGGQNNVTGGILCGETATIQVDVGGNAGIMYCSKVANQLNSLVSPLRMTKWRDISGTS